MKANKYKENMYLSAKIPLPAATEQVYASLVRQRSKKGGRPNEPGPCGAREAVMKQLLQWLYVALLAMSAGLGSFLPI